MRHGLTIVVSGSDPDRLRSALGIAAAEAALGGRVRLFFDAGAAPVLSQLSDSLKAMLAAALDLGAQVSICQSGLADGGIDIATLDPRFEPSGLVALMSTVGEDRLLLA